MDRVVAHLWHLLVDAVRLLALIARLENAEPTVDIVTLVGSAPLAVALPLVPVVVVPLAVVD